jgi:hypothetical protein
MSYWFRPKRYGYGASPANWKGWLATLAFIVFVAGMSRLLEPGRNGLGGGNFLVWLAVFGIAMVLFVWIVRKKTEGTWRWRWGSEEKEK